MSTDWEHVATDARRGCGKGKGTTAWGKNTETDAVSGVGDKDCVKTC